MTGDIKPWGWQQVPQPRLPARVALNSEIVNGSIVWRIRHLLGTHRREGRRGETWAKLAVIVYTVTGPPVGDPYSKRDLNGRYAAGVRGW